MSDVLSEDEAITKAKNFLRLDESYKIKHSRLNSDWRNEGEYIWHFNFENEDEENKAYISISINAKSSEIKSFSKGYYHDKDDTAVYDKNDALDIAKTYINFIQPDKSQSVEYAIWNEPKIINPLEEEYVPRYYTFKFVRVNDGGYVLDDGFNITVDSVSGDIVRYNYSWYKGKLPSLDSIIPLDKAHNILFEEIGLNLEYINNRPYYYPQEKEDENNKLNLVYNINDDIPLNIDPFSGKILNHMGEEYKKNVIVKYDDIENSYAKSEIEVLSQYGISLPGNKFNPKQNITQREFLYLLNKVENYNLLNSNSN